MSSTSVAALQAADVCVFGAAGHLAMHKIFPALLLRHGHGQLPAESRFFAVDVAQKDTAGFLQQFEPFAQSEAKPMPKWGEAWKAFQAQTSYHAITPGKALPASIKARMDEEPRPVRMFYIATGAEHYAGICQQLQDAGLITPDSRIVLEKPLGSDMASFLTMDAAVSKFFREDQIYRIDHYLGKETVQNLMILRFANPLLARTWNADAIDHVQITVSESAGIAGRSGFYDAYGALKDMVQNHLLQMLCLVAMEPPSHISPETIRAEKIKVLRALRPMTRASIATDSVRGQYSAGEVNGEAVSAYVQDAGKPSSQTESFVALKTHVDNWRWSGVPFYLRTGKRLKSRYSEVVLQFRSVPHQIFPDQEEHLESNRLVIRLQPDESIRLNLVTKEPGPGGYRLKPVSLNLSLAKDYAASGASAYERLMMDVVRGNPTLFMHRDEVIAAWEWIDTITALWSEAKTPLHLYTAGGIGPTAAEQLMQHDGREWNDPQSA